MGFWSGIWDPEKTYIPDTGVKKASDPGSGSATLPAGMNLLTRSVSILRYHSSGRTEGMKHNPKHGARKKSPLMRHEWGNTAVSLLFLVFGVENAGGGGRDPHHQVGQLLIATQYVLKDISASSELDGLPAFICTPVLRIQDVYHIFCNIIIIVLTLSMYI
jgi:hypothetical protein